MNFSEYEMALSLSDFNRILDAIEFYRFKILPSIVANDYATYRDSFYEVADILD